MLLAIPVALLAGLVSFASPCVLPLVPGYVGYVGGMAGAEGGAGAGGRRRGRMLLGVALFIAGFTAVFVAMTALVTSLGLVLVQHQDLITRLLGVIVLLLGLAFLGAFPFLQRERRLHVSPRAGLVGAPILGIVFALGWVPCIGPTLAAVLTLAYDQESPARAIALTITYCIGLGVPFFLVALGLRSSRRMLGWLTRHRLGVMRFGGVLLTLIGILLVTGLWNRLTLLLQGLIDSYDLVI
ncbi:cytochrome c biogenesis protein CcdA [Pseudactinotalea sp. HY160]|nr:cytochrome c biogenesis CcdA family protein [Pseudactinotalea sp. HY160]MPV50480.1 cytochrome c biogenesis protein CcdA [Pseudactinotalea sp. HY160]QGH71119.1 cytochrome c biogenesis protein CcdA [Pseudactinotalea sp. HY158]